MKQGSILTESVGSRLAISALLFFLVLAVFAPALRGGFITNYDDGAYVTGNHIVQRGLTRSGVRWAFTTGHACNWHPLTWLSHMLDVQLYGMNPWGHHLTSVLIHALNTALLFWVLHRMQSAARCRVSDVGDQEPGSPSLWPSALVAAIFAVHPLRVESVAWVAERKDVLCGFFFLLTLLAYSRHVQEVSAQGPAISGQSEGKPGHSKHSRQTVSCSPITLRWYLLTLLLFALALMAKPMAVTLPFVLLLLDYWPLGRWRNTDCGSRTTAEGTPKVANQRHPFGRRKSMILLDKIPFLALSLASCIVTLVVQKHGGAVAPISEFPASFRLANAALSYITYVRKLVYPGNLAFFYPHKGGSVPLWQALGAVLALAAICAAVIKSRRRCPFLLTGWFWYLGMLVPVIGFVQVGAQALADRYTYLPTIGLLIAGVWSLAEGARCLGSPPLEERRPFPNRVCPDAPAPHSLLRALSALLVAAILVACIVKTRWEIQWWRDTKTLYQHAIRVTDRSFMAHYNFGGLLAANGQYAEAARELTQALELSPRDVETLNALGTVLFLQGYENNAKTCFEEAAHIDPNNAETWCNLGRVAAKQGQATEAIRLYDRALTIRTDLAEAHEAMGALLSQTGQLAAAMDHYQHLLRLKPNHAGFHNSAGNLLLRMGHAKDAIAYYREAIRLSPSSPEPQNNMGKALLEINRPEEALPLLEKALQLRPSYPEAHRNLARALTTLNRPAEAEAHLREALRLNASDTGAQHPFIELERSEPP